MLTRPFWLVVGGLALALAAAGVVLPLLPTTPFLLVAAFAFARSSPRLHAWLTAHPLFGPLIENWRRYGAISRRAKITAVAGMGCVLALSIGMGANRWVLAVQALVIIGSAAFILTRPDGPPPGA
jgi:uncharacterized membrane protein YbaN (DUF454 family)